MRKLWPALLISLFVSGGCGQKFEQLLNKSRVSFEQKNFTQVIDDINLALPRWNQNCGLEKKAEAYQLLGKSYQALRKLDQASEAYQEALKFHDMFDAAYELGLLQLSNGEPEKARESFQIALRVKANDPRANLGLGDSLFQQNRLEEARVFYQKVIRFSPAVEDAMKNLELINKQLSKSAPPPLQNRKPRQAVAPIRKVKRR